MTKNFDSPSSSPAAPSMLELGRRLLGAFGAFVVLIACIWLWLAWMQVNEGQKVRMAAASKLLAGEANNYFSAAAAILRNLSSSLRNLDPIREPELVKQRLRDFRGSIPDALNVSIVGTDGRILVSTEPLPANARQRSVMDRPEWREDFAESLSTIAGVSVSRPWETMLPGHWVIPVRLTVPDRQGRPAYVIQADLLLEKQQELWRSLKLQVDTVFGLYRDDGYLISRFPGEASDALYYRSRRGGALAEAILQTPVEGTYSGIMMADDSYRIGAYRKLDDYPLYAFISQERSVIATVWWRVVRVPLFIALISLLTSAIAYLVLARRYGTRMRELAPQLVAGPIPGQAVPSSGVREIDDLVAALAQSREKLRAVAQNREKLLLAAAAAGTYTVRVSDDVVVQADTMFAAMLGRNENDICGHPWQEFFSDSREFADSGTDLEESARILQVATEKDTPARWLSVAEYLDKDAAGVALRHGLAIDVTDRERLLTQVNLHSQRLQALWQVATTRDKTEREKMQLMLQLAREVLSMDSVIVFEISGDQLVVREVDNDLGHLHVQQRIALKDALCQQTIAQRASVRVADLRADTELYRHPFAVQLGIRGYASVPIWAGSDLFGVMTFLRLNPLADESVEDDRAFMELLSTWFGQILLEERQRQELRDLAMTDVLTHLINRRAADVRFQEEFARARRARESFSIAICDLDRFKLINDHYGHDVGDQVLLHVAEIMKSHLREGDWVARWGGEEFIIFLHRTDATAATAAMERLRLAIKGNPVTTAHGPLDVTTSIGIGGFRGEGDLAAVLSEADGCLFEAKRAGRDRVVMSESNVHGTLWRAGMLQHALIERRVLPAYQVIVDLRTGKAVADEALARLIEPDRRIVSASEFIDAAEGINFIHVVDEVVARQAIQRCAVNSRGRIGAPGYAHFINLSPQFLARRDLVQSMLALARESCIDCGIADGTGQPLVLEITERQLLGDFDALRNDLQPLLDFGFRLALDDFGSGYSSFLYLASLPVSFLKIEGWMIRNMHGNPKVLAMVQSIIALARDQGITTIAECVEDAATAELLRELGVDWAQGWYFGRPECEGDPFMVLRPTGSD